MNIILHFASEFETCYLANGLFAEDIQNVSYPTDEAMYVTALPLSAVHLPYTIKLIGGHAVTNKNLAKTYTLPRNNYLIKLQPRYNYVYSPQTEPAPSLETNAVSRFFGHVKSKDWPNARLMMTDELSQTLSDNSLVSFFEDYVDIIQNKYLPSDSHVYFFASDDGSCIPYRFSLVSGLIDNIEEYDL